MPEPTDTVVRGRAPVGDGRVLSPVALRVVDGRIAEIASDEAAPDVVVAPGFVDLQVNGMGDVDCAVASGDDWVRLAERLAGSGVTAWLPTLVSRPLDRYPAALERITDAMDASASGVGGPVVLGVHLEGPFLGGRPGAHRRDDVVPIDHAWLDALPPSVRLVTMAPEQPDAGRAIASLVARGVAVSLGHSSADHATAAAAVAAGAAMVTHLFNGMAPFHHRDPGLVGVGLADDRLTVGLIADRVHVHPLLFQTVFRAKGPGRVALVTDAVGGRPGPHGLEVVAIDDAPRLADGTLAGSILTMDRAVRNVVDAGVDVPDALRAAGQTPATVLGDTGRGRIEVGARADLVVLGGSDLAVRRTLVGGRTVWEC